MSHINLFQENWTGRPKYSSSKQSFQLLLVSGLANSLLIHWKGNQHMLVFDQNSIKFKNKIRFSTESQNWKGPQELYPCVWSRNPWATSITNCQLVFDWLPQVLFEVGWRDGWKTWLLITNDLGRSRISTFYESPNFKSSVFWRTLLMMILD